MIQIIFQSLYVSEQTLSCSALCAFKAPVFTEILFEMADEDPCPAVGVFEVNISQKYSIDVLTECT